MVTLIISTDSAAPLNLTADNDAFVASGATISTASTTILGADSNHNVTVAGTVTSTGGNQTFAIRLGDNIGTQDSGNSIEVLAGGSVYANYMAIVMQGSGLSLVNRGTIVGGQYGVDFDNPDVTTTDSITNYGLILSETAILRNGATLGNLNITNSGTIIGHATSFDSFGATAVDKIYNKGRMQGNIVFEGGNDLYDGRGGTFIGTAFGGAGDDTFIGGNGVERFNGGIGADKFTGGLGRDVLTMGTGPGDGIDKIIFNSLTEIGDIVTDFTTADFFQFKKSAFGNLALGTLSSAAYWENTTGAAHDASDRFIFETDTSRLWYDKDGTGSAAKVLVVDMSNTVNISNADIQII